MPPPMTAAARIANAIQPHSVLLVASSVWDTAAAPAAAAAAAFTLSPVVVVVTVVVTVG